MHGHDQRQRLRQLQRDGRPAARARARPRRSSPATRTTCRRPTRKTTLIYANAPGTGGGAFVIGDQSQTGTVTFWGSQWSTTNKVSGGAAPSAFKGFAKYPASPTCGATFTTDPGNSAPPPNGPLPAYMSVIVTSKVTKSGSTISGTIVKIVIVKTNAGYDSDPGHPGTGTVVATVC